MVRWRWRPDLVALPHHPFRPRQFAVKEVRKLAENWLMLNRIQIEVIHPSIHKPPTLSEAAAVAEAAALSILQQCAAGHVSAEDAAKQMTAAIAITE